MEEGFISVSLPECLWRTLIPLIDSERQSLLDKVRRVEGLYGEVLIDDAQELTAAIQEIELNLIVKEK